MVKKMLNKTLEMALVRAIREAKGYRHEYVTVEHMLYGLLYDELTTHIISQCGGSIDNLKQRLEATLLCREIVQEVVAAALAAATSKGQPRSTTALGTLAQARSTDEAAEAAVRNGSTGGEPGQHSLRTGGGCCSIM
jgi:ATP-dependent Clp protease ATP-binding subunit ClpA